MFIKCKNPMCGHIEEISDHDVWVIDVYNNFENTIDKVVLKFPKNNEPLEEYPCSLCGSDVEVIEEVDQ